jgi:hypothetical protein
MPRQFVDQIDRPWVRSVASVGEDRAAELQEQWIEVYFQEENRLPDWSGCDHRALVARLISLCRESIDSDLDLLLVWLLEGGRVRRDEVGGRFSLHHSSIRPSWTRPGGAG